MKKIVVGMTGASGSIYAKRMVEYLSMNNIEVILVSTENGKKVFEYELERKYEDWVKELSEKNKFFKEENNNNLFAGIASGSYGFDAVVILPCSMGTMGQISGGITNNLLTRAADVALKENRTLIVVPRETPLNQIHLENMLKIARCGGTILPAMPGFYHKPQNLEEIVDFIIGKILDNLRIENKLFEKWS